jgi:4-hydroxy 2-oxovalerate aldolase
MNQPILLDCTLRDGGYYNSWNFSKDLIQEYIFAIKEAGVDVMELGFRLLEQDNLKGDCAYTSDSFIRSLEIPKDLIICVMINASDIISGGKLNEQNLNQLFPNSSESSKISIVRIAAHSSEFIEALKSINILKAKGYKVGINLMQISESNSEDIINLSRLACKYPIEVLYFADSLGNMDTKKICNVIHLIKTHWKGALGFHAHDNMALSFSNSLHSLENGVTWLDSTVLGMGRGAGNVKTELLAIEFSKLRNQNPKFSPLISLISKQFNPLKLKHCWGTNTFYYLSAIKGIHPTYIQEILTKFSIKEDEILFVIEYISSKRGNMFSKDLLESAIDALRIS